MPDYELHADYDNDGILSGSRTEYALRSTRPGAVVVPNLDIDSRQLPAGAVTALGRQRLDANRLLSRRSDDEQRLLQIRVQNPSAPPGVVFLLRCDPRFAYRIHLRDANDSPLRNPMGVSNEFILPPFANGGVLDISLSVSTIVATPKGSTSNLNLTYTPDMDEESVFHLELLAQEGRNFYQVYDRGCFHISPFVLMDTNAPCRRLFICDLPDNEASVKEVWRVCRQIGVPLTKIPESTANGDTWIQDQYQHAIMEGVDGYRQLILHLPRLRKEMLDSPVAANLERFVNAHFPSRNIGLFDKLWERELPVKSTDLQPLRLDFRETLRLSTAMNLVYVLMRRINEYGQATGSNWQVISFIGTWSEIRRGLRRAKTRLDRHLDQAVGDASSAQTRIINARKTTVAEIYRIITTNFPLSSSGITISTTRSSAELTNTRADELFLRISQMNSGGNYGGNIESTPPVYQAPLGKIIVGNKRDDEYGDFMDPDLLSILAKQKKQPIIEVDTTWLRVGHVDEVAAIIPSRMGTDNGFGAVTASPRVALSLIRNANLRYLSGLPQNHHLRTNHFHPSQILSRYTSEGRSPVTHLFRGKTWLHQHARNQDIREVPTIKEPPAIFRKLARGFGTASGQSPRGFNFHGIGYLPGSGGDRHYPADISIREVLWANWDKNGQNVNDFIDANFIAPIRTTLQEELPGSIAYEIPVLFDIVDDIKEWQKNSFAFSTSAFSPDCVNMQFVNGHVLIPRPYGPRMLPADAIAVVKETARELGFDRIVNRVGNRLIRRHRLTRGIYWIYRRQGTSLYSRSGSIITSFQGMYNEDDVIRVFKDSFPGADGNVLRRNIIRPNQRHFDRHGVIKDGARKFVINDGMVDLFELFTLAVMEDIGVTPHFVDSWFYHNHDGGIHCGTNVLRSPGNRTGMPRHWEVPDHEFRVESYEFEPEVNPS
jgi:hypothetical protein